LQIDNETLIQNYKERSTDELLELHAAGTLTDMACEILENELRSREIKVPARPDTPRIAQATTASSFIKQHWKGERNLGSAFWIIGGVGAFLYVAAVIAIAFLVSDLMPGDKDFRFSVFLGILIVLPVPYLIFSWVSIWRCAWNTRWQGWGYIARFIVVVEIVRFATIVTGNAL